MKIYAYSQATISGIPGNNQDNTIVNSLPKKYYIYAAAAKGTALNIEGIWINEKYYTIASFNKIKTPVVLSNAAVPVKEKDTLVKKTADDVYKIEIGEERKKQKVSEEEEKLIKQNPVVIVLKNKTIVYYSIAASITELAPVAGM